MKQDFIERSVAKFNEDFEWRESSIRTFSDDLIDFLRTQLSSAWDEGEKAHQLYYGEKLKEQKAYLKQSALEALEKISKANDDLTPFGDGFESAMGRAKDIINKL